MASSDNNNNNNANEHGARPEKDEVPSAPVESTQQATEEVKSESVNETGEKHSADKSGEAAVERAQETKLESEPAELSAPVSTKQEPAPPDPAAEPSAIAPDTTAQPSTTGESNVGSQQPKNDTNTFNTQESQFSTLTPKPSDLETQPSKSEIENAPAEPSTHTAHEESEDAGPSVTITLLLTTGARHPFRINERYLRKRAIDAPDYDPFKMSVYTLKELILREWRTEWETRPSSPSAIRLIFFGKLLEDKSPISEYKFNQGAPNVVHMTVKPQELMDEEDAKTAKSSHGRDREASEPSPGCRCVIL